MKSPRPSKKTKPSKPQQEVELTPEQKMQAAVADQAKWSRVAADPDLSPAAAAWAAGAARSAAAEVKLRQKAQSPDQILDPNLAITLGQPWPPDQATSSGPKIPGSSIKPETSS